MQALTTAGAVTGEKRETPFGAVHRYRAIPYGHAERFRAPGPVRAWSGVRDATAAAPAAPQNPDPIRAGRGLPPLEWDEASCLNATVWAPATTGSRPVMVWVHGGAFTSGAPATHGTDAGVLAARGDVVVVALGYRLGAFGFLHLADVLGDEFRAAGNAALLDLVAGLRWVRENATAFGGDPDRVTLFGESAGAAAIGTMLGMPEAAGLFQRAILQSGTAERVRTRDAACEATDRFLHAAGLTTRTAAELLDWSAERILQAQQRLGEEVAARTLGVPLPFVPVIDGLTLPRTPLETVRAGGLRGVELIAGTNLDEASFSVTMLPADRRTGVQVAAMLSQELEGTGIDPVGYRAALARDTGVDPAPIDALAAVLADRQYRQPTNRLLSAHHDAGGAAFAYLFTWPSPAMGGVLGTPHTLDLPFVFGNLSDPDAAALLGSAPPIALADAWGGAWATFARDGVPRATGLPAWPRYDRARRATMVFDAECRIVNDPRAALRRLWEDAGR